MRNLRVALTVAAWGAVVLMAGCQSPAASEATGTREPAKPATRQIYVFAGPPAWTGPLEMTDRPDPLSWGQRMFVSAARAEDGRHVVLIQSPSYDRMFGAKIREGGILVYAAPNGFKVWGGGPQKWYAGILLRGARAVIKDPPSENRIGYILESPTGTFPALAVNGPVTDEELHRLVDSLVPAPESPDHP